MKTTLKGILEIDHDRGVIYFHLSEKEDVTKRGVVTVLRICNLPTPVPEIKERGIDIIHMKNIDYLSEEGF